MTIVMNAPIAAGKFKATCLQLLDEVEERRTEFVITKHGRAVARLVPMEAVRRPIFGRMQGSASITGDLLAPLGVSWNAETDE